MTTESGIVGVEAEIDEQSLPRCSKKPLKKINLLRGRL